MVTQLISVAKTEPRDLTVVEAAYVQVVDQIQVWRIVLQQAGRGEEARTAQGLLAELAEAATALRAAANADHTAAIDLEAARLEAIIARAKQLAADPPGGTPHCGDSPSAADSPAPGTGLVGALALAVEAVQHGYLALPQFEAIARAAAAKVSSLQSAYADPMVAALPHVQEFQETLKDLAGAVALMETFSTTRNARVLQEGFAIVVAADGRLAELARIVQETLSDLSRNGLGVA